MKNGRFENQLEIFKHLAEGGAVKLASWPDGECIMLGEGGDLIAESGKRAECITFDGPSSFIRVVRPELWEKKREAFEDVSGVRVYRHGNEAYAPSFDGKGKRNAKVTIEWEQLS